MNIFPSTQTDVSSCTDAITAIDSAGWHLIVILLSGCPVTVILHQVTLVFDFVIEPWVFDSHLVCHHACIVRELITIITYLTTVSG